MRAGDKLNLLLLRVLNVINSFRKWNTSCLRQQQDQTPSNESNGACDNTAQTGGWKFTGKCLK